MSPRYRYGTNYHAEAAAVVRRRLPPAPEEFAEYTAPRAATALTAAHGIEFRLVRPRPRKTPIACPPDAHPTTVGWPHPKPLWWQRPITDFTPAFWTTLNTDAWIAATDIIVDPLHRQYLIDMYTHGLHDHCELPLNAQRLHVKNSVKPGTAHGDAWDDLIDEQEARGRIIEMPAPLVAGTVLNPMGCIDKVKVALDGSEKIKYRPYIDGRSTREGRRNIGDWCDPRNRQYTNQTIHETIARFIADDAAAANIFDYKNFYLTMPCAMQTVASNAIYWRRRGARSPTVIYSLDEWFGQVPTPSKVELHAQLLQLLQEKALSTAAGHTIHMSRRTDDTVLTLRTDEVTRARFFADIFLRVCSDVNQPIQPTKVLVGVTVFKFDGYLFNLIAFANNRFGVHPGGVGIDTARSADIHQRLRACLRGTDRKHVEKLGLLEWVAILTPHIRALIYTMRSAMLATKTDTDAVVMNGEATSDLQRLLHHFPPRHAPDMVPFYKLYRLTPHDIDIFTDASGNDAFGGT